MTPVPAVAILEAAKPTRERTVMAKTWEQLNNAEKIEELRRDILKTMARVNQLDAHSDVLESGISKIVGDLRRLESRVAKLEPQKPEERLHDEKAGQPKHRRKI
jgi:hypothetical protein